MVIQGKVAVVTGAGGGIGRQLVLQLLSRGARVAALDINRDSLKATADAAGESTNSLSLHTVDITDRVSVCSLPQAIKDLHGGVDILINNAGIIQPFIPFAEMEYDQIRRVFDINVYGTIFMTKAFLPFLVEAREAVLVNVSSMGGFVPVPGQTIYGASKAAVKLLTEGLRSELANTNIHVAVVFPGGVNTNITKNSGVEMKDADSKTKSMESRLTTPENAAGMILKGVEKNRSRIIVGKDSRFLDIFSRVSPQKAGDFISRMMKTMLATEMLDGAVLRAKACPDPQD